MKEKLKKFGLKFLTVISGLGIVLVVIRSLFAHNNKEPLVEFPSKKKKELEKHLEKLDTEKAALDEKQYSDEEISKRYNK